MCGLWNKYIYFFSSSWTIAASLPSLNVIIICFITGISFISSPWTHFLIFRIRISIFHGMMIWWFLLVTHLAIDSKYSIKCKCKCNRVLIVFFHFLWCFDGCCFPLNTLADLLIVIQTNDVVPTIQAKLRVEQWSEKPNRPLALLRITYTIQKTDSSRAFFSSSLLLFFCCSSVLSSFQWE